MANNNQSSPPNPPEPVPQESQKTKNKFILVAEDDRFYANIYNTRLTREGYDVVVASDGEQALKIARDRKPDLILLDLILPVKDGFETLEELRADNELKNVKVVVLSNLGQEADVQRVKKLGVEAYLVKTDLSIQEMIDKVKSCLSE